MKAQISTEYLIILGIAIAAILPAGYFFYTYSSASNDQAIRAQIENIGNEMLISAQSVYGLAEGSLVSLDVKNPKEIKDITILNKNEVVITYELSTGIAESVLFSNIDLSGNVTLNYLDFAPPQADSRLSKRPINPGKSVIKFESKTSYVLITKP